MSVAKMLLWGIGGAFLLVCLGILFLYGMAGLAMWKNAKQMDESAKAQQAAFLAMTPEQHMAMAREFLKKDDSPAGCLSILKSVPEGTPGRAELFAEATRRGEAKQKEEAAFNAMTPEQHFAAAKVALSEKRPYDCRGHLMWVPRDTPGRAEVAAEADRQAEALEAKEAAKAEKP